MMLTPSNIEADLLRACTAMDVRANLFSLRRGWVGRATACVMVGEAATGVITGLEGGGVPVATGIGGAGACIGRADSTGVEGAARSRPPTDRYRPTP
jgi:hypothetical protein